MMYSGFYNELEAFANYGPIYRRIQKCYLSTGTDGSVNALLEIRGNGKDIPK